MENLLSYDDAIKSGHRYYFTGIECIHGHLSKRYVSSKGCCECYLNRVHNKHKTIKGKLYRTIQRKKWKQKNKAAHNKHSQKSGLKIRHNITLIQKELMLKNQDNKCKTCGKPVGYKTACIDHNHTTGKIRDILCQQCNVGIGFAKEDTTILQNWIDYLRHHSA